MNALASLRQADLNDWQKLIMPFFSFYMIMLFFGFYMITTFVVPSIFNYKCECIKSNLCSSYSYKFIQLSHWNKEVAEHEAYGLFRQICSEQLVFCTLAVVLEHDILFANTVLQRSCLHLDMASLYFNFFPPSVSQQKCTLYSLQQDELQQL